MRVMTLMLLLVAAMALTGVAMAATTSGTTNVQAVIATPTITVAAPDAPPSAWQLDKSNPNNNQYLIPDTADIVVSGASSAQQWSFAVSGSNSGRLAIPFTTPTVSSAVLPVMLVNPVKVYDSTGTFTDLGPSTPSTSPGTPVTLGSGTGNTAGNYPVYLQQIMTPDDDGKPTTGYSIVLTFTGTLT